ncbi:MAG: hypothetical protein QOK24_2512 [Verrucomicrobiota bacterium]|jgi:ketosteroid isomerase-like protein
MNSHNFFAELKRRNVYIRRQSSLVGHLRPSNTPVHKDHITDWITAQTSKGLVFKTDGLKPASIQVTGDAAMVCYWITFKWVDKAGNGPAHTLRITHAWLKTGGDWRIIGGMSMPEPDKPST